MRHQRDEGIPYQMWRGGRLDEKDRMKKNIPPQFNLYEFDGHAQTLPFELPTGKSGPFRIKHDVVKAGTDLDIVSLRNALFMGLDPTRLQLSRDTIIHQLVENKKALWMTSMPQEIEQHERQLKRFHGRVLVGGLGLGWAVSILHCNPEVKTIVCVEKSPDVINLVQPHLPQSKLVVVQADLFELLRLPPKRPQLKYDFAFYDIWCPTSQRSIYKYTFPLRQLSQGIVDNENIECWNESEMIGQVQFAISSLFGFGFKHPVLTMPEKQFQKMVKVLPETWPFYNFFREHYGPTKLNRFRERRYRADKLESWQKLYCECLSDPSAMEKHFNNYRHPYSI